MSLKPGCTAPGRDPSKSSIPIARLKTGYKKFGNLSLWLGLFLLSAASLAFEISLTRLFSVEQFYHFAFMIVSVALLGFGASGTALAVFPALRKGSPSERLGQWSLAAGVCILLAYLLTNRLPFDSFSIAWDRRQVWILILHYVALAAPFFFSGLALGFLLAAFPKSAGPTYAVNLLGSAAGCATALVAPPFLGGEGMVTLSSALAMLAAIAALARQRPFRPAAVLGATALLLLASADLGLRLAGRPGFNLLDLRLSPYKSLSYAMQYPGSQVIYRRWNAFSRLDVVRSGGIHSLPGLSYRYLQPLPRLDGLLVDGDDLSPVVQSSTDPAFTHYLPGAVAFLLRPRASTLLLEPRGGLDILTALALSTGPATAVEINPLIVAAAPIYADPRLQVFVESDRSYLRRAQTSYDVIMLSLAASFHPVRSGAYTLAEDYRYTVESFQDALRRLAPGGLLVTTRWLQDPPSEDLRLFALAVTAVEASGGDPKAQIVAFRGYNTATVLVKQGAFASVELSTIREFARQRAFDLSYAPGIQPGETNRYNVLKESRYYQTYLSLLDAQPRQAFYAAYDYDVRPPTDDHPFFGHYFKWAQAPQVLVEFGRAWQPFGGAGYFVVLALLALATLLACLLILLPVGLWKLANRGVQAVRSPFPLRNLAYFGFLGFAFLFVEIPLMQRFILYLENPAYAVMTVLFALLFFSGLGSAWSGRLPLLLSLGALVALILAMPLLLPPLFAATLGLPLAARLGLTALALAPLGFLMGVPFPAGMRSLARSAEQGLEDDPRAGSTPSDIPWIWAVNGAASVISAILAALLALTFGFRAVLWTGALCYLGALLTARRSLRQRAARSPGR
jgi:hypothetical protein